MATNDGFFSGSANKDKRIAGDYTIEDKKNVINFYRSGRSKPKEYELESLLRQTRADAGNLSVGDVKVASADTGEGFNTHLKDTYGFDINSSIWKNLRGDVKNDIRGDYKDDMDKLKYKEGSLLNQAKPTEGNILTKTGNFIANIFTPPAVAGTLEGKPTRFAGEADPTPRPKLDYVNPDKKVMTGSEIRDAFRPSNLFGMNRNEIGGKLGTYDSPGSPLARDRQETMNRVATKYSSMPAPDARSLSQIREDRAAKMKTDAQQRQATFKDTGIQTFGGKVQPQKSADDTYGTNMVSNPAFGFRSKMSEENKAKYDQSSRLATERAKTDPSLGNVITQTFNRLSGAVGGPQASLESIGERQLRAANKEINRPTYQKEAYARQALGITNQMLKDRNMQIIRQNAKARNEAFQAARKQRIAGTDRTVGGGRGSSQANTGSGRDGGFGTGTYGKGMPSNPKGFSGYSRKSSPGTGTGTSTSRGGISRSTSRGQGGGTASRSKGGTSRGGSKSSSSGSRGQGGGSASRSKGGTGTGQSRSGGTTGRTASRASKSRTGRSRSQCDIRTKIDIAPLTNQDLIRDDLANVAYFVKEIK